MAHKQLLLGSDARAKLLKGATALADAVRITLGPRSKSVLIAKKWGAPIVCNDGVTIAKELELKDLEEDLGVRMIRQAAERTGDAVGDGTSTSALLAHAIYADGVRNVEAGASAHAAGRKLAGGCEPARLGDGQDRQWHCIGAPERAVHVVHRGEVVELTRAYDAAEQRRGMIFVDHRLRANQRTGRRAHDRHAAATTAEHDEVMVRFHMYRSFDLSRAIERVLVRGGLDDARALAASLASGSEPPALEAWARQAALVRERAAALAAAPGIDEACRRAARLSEACAACHVAAGAGPAFDAYPGAPLDEPSLEARMARHRWAVDRLWEGMVGNADKPWRAGLDVLAVTPLPFSAVAGDRVTLASRLQQARQRRLTTPTERAALYGEMLVVCAACHSGRATTPR